MNKPLLHIENLSIHLTLLYNKPLKVIDELFLSIKQGETLCLVGESGCGKSITAKAILQLIPEQLAQYSSGSIYFEGKDLLQCSAKELQSIRGSKIAMIFQEPMNSLNPVMQIGEQLTEAFLAHHTCKRQEARERAIEFLGKTGLQPGEFYYKHYPHELSGGMRQRAMIAMALICTPQLILADEPTTALDVTLQKQILSLIKETTQKQKIALLLITHDFNVVSYMADQVAVMYAGKIIEYAEKKVLIEEAKHPYTQGLLASRPLIEIESTTNEISTSTNKKKKRLATIKGTVPPLGQEVQGCIFHPRCDHTMEICMQKNPPLITLAKNQKVACWLYRQNI